MALKIRLRQQGKKNQYVYRVVLTDTRSPRDGKYIEMLGWYNPFANETQESVSMYADRVMHWLNNGAEISEKVTALLKKCAPQVLEAYRQKLATRQSKICEKKKAWRKKKEAAVS